MAATAVLPENYCVCVGEDGAPRELGRSGHAVTYKAIGYQSGQPVALQLIPLASLSEEGRARFEAKARSVRKLKHPNIARLYDVRVEDDHLVFATEFLQGESAEQWVVAHGPMPADAVLRIGLQVVSALAEAAFHSLSHRAIQPSNLMIVNGATPNGDWPFVKLLNFGLAGLKIYSDETDELAPVMGAAFASPEQLEKGRVDFPSEIFSLGATMCFLLTGAVPTAGRARRAGESERVLPKGARIPGPLRKLLRQMLRIDPEQRPHDPLLLTGELRRCLAKVERRPAWKLAAAATPTERQPAPVSAPRGRWLGPMLTAATVLLLLGAVAILLLPGQLRSWVQRDRPLESIGVPVGVPDSAPNSDQASAPRNETAITDNSPAAEEKQRGKIEQLLAESAASPSPAISAAPEESKTVAQNSPQPSPTAAPEIAQAPPEATAPPALAANSPAAGSVPEVPQSPPSGREVVINGRTAEPAPPAEGPPPASAEPPENARNDIAEQSAAPDASEKISEAPADAEQPQTRSNAPPKVASQSGKTKRNPITTRRETARTSRDGRLPPMRVGSQQAQFLRTTDDGKWMLRLPSGETVVTPPLPKTNVSDAPLISHRKVRKVQTPPRALPAENGPPVIVLPPANSQP